jgi:uncharacterized protein (TIGR01244 family)
MDARTINGWPVGQPADHPGLQAIADQGFRAIICNRPDGEGNGPAELRRNREAAARPLGLQAAYLPITAGKVATRTPRPSASLLTELPGPVLAYCRTGTRSATLWSLAMAGANPCRHPRRHARRPATTWAAWCAASPMAARPHRSRDAPRHRHRRRRRGRDRRRLSPEIAQAGA